MKAGSLRPLLPLRRRKRQLVGFAGAVVIGFTLGVLHSPRYGVVTIGVFCLYVLIATPWIFEPWRDDARGHFSTPKPAPVSDAERSQSSDGAGGSVR